MRIMQNFSYEDQELLRKFIFTNPHGQTSFIYPQSLYTGEEHLPFISAYSRSKLPLQDKVLQFLDKDKPTVVRRFLPMIPEIIRLTRKQDGTLKVPMTTALFNRKWAVLMHHNSIKEQAQFFGYMENVSDLLHHASTGSHPLCSPLAKSSRYVFWDGDFPEADKDILSLPNQAQNLGFIKLMNQRYVESVEALTSFVSGHRFTQELIFHLKQESTVEQGVKKWVKQQQLIRESKSLKPEEIRAERSRIINTLKPENLQNSIRQFVLDYARVYLIAAVKTSVGFSMNGRNLGDMIVSMISTPRKEDQERGHELLHEAKKIAPVVLGSLGVEDWQLGIHTKLRDWMEQRFPQLMHAAKPRKLVKLIPPGRFAGDRFMAAQVVFPYVHASLETIYKTLLKQDIEDVLFQAHKYRGKGIHQALCHDGLIAETTLPWHANRDILRHRRGSRTRQLLSTRIGYRTPELFVIAGLDEQLKKTMEQAKQIYEQARKHDRYVAEKLVPWGFNCRSLQSWHLNQIAYIIGLRSHSNVGHRRYVEFARQLWDQALSLYPETAKYIHGDRSEYPAELWKKGYQWWDAEGKFKHI